MDSLYEYRKYQPGDEAGIITLLRKVFPDWENKNTDYFLWKYVDSPHGSYVYLALDGNRVISVVCDMAMRIKIEDRMILGSYTDDVATDPDYRGRGIYKQVQATSREDRIANKVYFDYHATENPVISEHSKAILFPFPLRRMIKIKDVKKYLSSTGRDTWINRLGFNILRGSKALFERSDNKMPANENCSLETIKRFDEKVDAFWEVIRQRYNFILEKRMDYLNWRYCTYNPDEFTIKVAVKGDEILGYVALWLLEKETSSEGSILDLLTLPDRPDIIDFLIDASLNHLEEEGANSVYCQISSGHPLQTHLARKGFIDVTRASKNLIYYQNNEPGFDPKKFAEFDPKTVYFNFY